MKNNDDNNSKKKKIALIVAIAIVLVVIVGSGVAIGVFRIAKGSTKRSVFTDKLTTEATTQAAKATTEKATTEKATKASTEKATTEKAKASSTKAKTEGGVKKGSDATGSNGTDKSGSKATEAQTEAPQPVTEAQTEAPYVPDTEAPYVPDTEAPAPATTERATERATEAPTTQHQHSWEAITETTTEKVKVKDAWDEQVLKYYCSYCGADCDVVGSDHITYCGEKYYDEYFHKWLYEGASWAGGYETINHPAEYTTKEVTKTVGYKCSTCGATK